MAADKILYDIEQEPYSETITNYMRSHFNNGNKQWSFTRNFFHIPADDISHFTAGTVCKTMPGISKYHCFKITNSKSMQYRWLSCHAKAICGDWSKPYEFKLIDTVNINTNMNCSNSS